MDINLYYDDENPDNNVIENPLHLFMQEIELAIKTAPNQIWGFRHTLDLQKYVFNQYISLSDISDEISNFITKYCNSSSLFPFTVSAELMELNSDKFIYIKTTIQQGEESLTQKFLLA